MKPQEFKIGLEFWMSGAKWRCTDIGTRVVVAIKLDHPEDPSWYAGPPYAVAELVLDEHDLPACSLVQPDPLPDANAGTPVGVTAEQAARRVALARGIRARMPKNTGDSVELIRGRR